jgi:hypothetical protein
MACTEVKGRPTRVASGRGRETAGQGGQQGTWTWGPGRAGWAGAIDGDGGVGEVGEAGLAWSVLYQVRLWAWVGSGWEGAFWRHPPPTHSISKENQPVGRPHGGAGVDDEAGRKRERLEGIRSRRRRRQGMARQWDKGSKSGPEDEGQGDGRQGEGQQTRHGRWRDGDNGEAARGWTRQQGGDGKATARQEDESLH